MRREFKFLFAILFTFAITSTLIYLLTTRLHKETKEITWEKNGYSRTYYVRGDISTMFMKMAIFKIEGVQDVEAKPYEYKVTKAQCYEWDEIHPLIIEAINSAFGEYEQAAEDLM